MNEIEDLQRLLDGFSDLKIRIYDEPTFLEIANCPNLENVWSNILAFFLHPNKEHNLFDLLLKSLFESAEIQVKINNYKKIEIITEYTTIKRNRIDIVVISDNFVLGIENKINADLYNDLKDYSNTIDYIARQENLSAYKIVLSRYPTQVDNDFKNVTYYDFIKRINDRIGIYASDSNQKYLIFLIDFLKNIKNVIGIQNMEENSEIISFFLKNKEEIKRFIKYNDKMNQIVETRLNEIHKIILDKVMKEKKENTINKEYGVFTYNNYKIVKYYIIVNGISLFFQFGVLENEFEFGSHYWIENDNEKKIETYLHYQGVDKVNCQFDENNENIAKKMFEQIIKIITSIEKMELNRK